ncbi:MAG: endonuclease III domain-containing protein, partial [Thiohalorhabdaceae bacterium]
NIKAQRLQALCRFLLDEAGGELTNLWERDTSVLRAQLLGIKGVGEETADSILLYALDRPIFVVDAYTRRIFERLGLLETGLGYAEVQAAFEGALPRDRALFNEYHALVVALGKDYCKPKPFCATCPLRSLCPSAQA